MEVLYKYHFDEVNHGSWTNCIRNCHCWGWMAERVFVRPAIGLTVQYQQPLYTSITKPCWLRLQMPRIMKKPTYIYSGGRKLSKKMKKSGIFIVTCVRNEKRLADPFTKGLSKNVIYVTYVRMGMRPIWRYNATITHTSLIRNTVT